jgi:hypothetical protein
VSGGRDDLNGVPTWLVPLLGIAIFAPPLAAAVPSSRQVPWLSGAVGIASLLGLLLALWRARVLATRYIVLLLITLALAFIVGISAERAEPAPGDAVAKPPAMTRSAPPCPRSRETASLPWREC